MFAALWGVASISPLHNYSSLLIIRISSVLPPPCLPFSPFLPLPSLFLLPYSFQRPHFLPVKQRFVFFFTTTNVFLLPSSLPALSSRFHIHSCVFFFPLRAFSLFSSLPPLPALELPLSLPPLASSRKKLLCSLKLTGKNMA